MKKSILLGILLLILLSSNFRLVAQGRSHIPFTNGHWFYTIGQIDGITEISCVEIESYKDSIIDGEIVKEFDIYRKRGNQQRLQVSKELIREKNDTIWIKVPSKSEYRPLYSFLSNIGDTFYVSKSKFMPSSGFFSLSKDSLGPLMYLVTSKDSIYIGDKWRRRLGVLDIQNLNGLNWCFGLSDTTYFIEGIGSTSYFFGQSKYVTAATNKTTLRCFNQDSIHINFNTSSESCDYSILLGAKKIAKILPTVYFLNDKIEIFSPTDLDFNYKILSASGQELSNGKVANSIFIDFLQTGIYALILVTENGGIHTYKFYKQ